jgi:primosomal protein DnaI
MESINKTLAKMMNVPKFKERYEALKDEVLNEPYVRSFIAANPELTEKDIEKSLPKLFEYMSQARDCNKCGSLEQCHNMMQGYHPVLIKKRNFIDIQYEPCNLKIKADAKKKHAELIKSLFMPKDVLEASFDKLDEAMQDSHDDDRDAAIRNALDFVENYENKRSANGLYLYGPFGVGKTYIMGAIANRLAEKGISTLIVYSPEFFREMKNSIGDQTLQEKLDTVKKVPILIFDDLGAETLSSWTRDEVLGVILQYRMMEKLPTLYTSNYDYDELEEHLAYSQKNGIERVKAKRIMERIRHLTDSSFVGGKNRRN